MNEKQEEVDTTVRSSRIKILWDECQAEEIQTMAKTLERKMLWDRLQSRREMNHSEDLGGEDVVG